jgi:hypothetical protein
MGELNGVYRALVLDNRDPYCQERVLVSVYGVHDSDVGVWAEHVSYSNRISGDIPNISDIVFVMFVKNPNNVEDPNDCIWFGISNIKLS